MISSGIYLVLLDWCCEVRVPRSSDMRLWGGVVFFLFLLSITGAGGEEVHIKRLEVPEFVALGDKVDLRCQWEGPREKLYSLKWYFNDLEFFRYKPEDSPSKEILPLAGVNVSREDSTGEQVTLTNVQLNSSGKYKCEVIGEWPQFLTADKSSNMTVVEVPEDKPRITGTRHRYHIGDTAHLTCSSARSFPPAVLTWYINDKEAPKEYIIPLNNTVHSRRLQEAHKGLKFVVTRDHFHNGEMTLRCSAKIHSLYLKTQQHTVDGRLTYFVPVMESRDISAVSGGVVCGGQQLVVTLMAVVETVVGSWVVGSWPR
nr:uncharacterized protein LOC123772422 [Procambarus clarkii]